jgi:hypothetical protein
VLLCIKWINMHCLCVERRNKGIGHKNIFKIYIFAKNLAKNIGVFYCWSMQKIIIASLFLEKRHFLAKIVKVCDHNIDPRPIGRRLPGKKSDQVCKESKMWRTSSKTRAPKLKDQILVKDIFLFFQFLGSMLCFLEILGEKNGVFLQNQMLWFNFCIILQCFE